jgi:hypothetical protein
MSIWDVSTDTEDEVERQVREQEERSYREYQEAQRARDNAVEKKRIQMQLKLEPAWRKLRCAESDYGCALRSLVAYEATYRDGPFGEMLTRHKHPEYTIRLTRLEKQLLASEKAKVKYYKKQKQAYQEMDEYLGEQFREVLEPDE